MPWSLSESSHQFLLIAQTFSSPNDKVCGWKFFHAYTLVEFLLYHPSHKRKIPTSHDGKTPRKTSLLINYIQHFLLSPKKKFFAFFHKRMQKKKKEKSERKISCSIIISLEKKEEVHSFWLAIAMEDKRKKYFSLTASFVEMKWCKTWALRQAKLTTASMKHSESIIPHLWQ